jgi:putative hemolysin
VSEEELKVMISSGEVSQVLEEDEREMIDGVFDLRRTVAAEIMTPRMSINAVPDDLEQDEMVRRLRELPTSRVLVYHESLDELVGFLLVKEVLLNPLEPWRKHLRESFCVPDGIGLLDLLRSFRTQRTKMAVVVDEYGGVEGIVTLQDLLEEIVGDMYEQHEHQRQDLIELEPGHWRVLGSLTISELGDELEVSFPEQRGRTVGGFVMNTLGRIPRVGDEVQHEDLILRVETMVARRVNTVLVERPDLRAEANGNEVTETAEGAGGAGMEGSQ